MRDTKNAVKYLYFVVFTDRHRFDVKFLFQLLGKWRWHENSSDVRGCAEMALPVFPSRGCDQLIVLHSVTLHWKAKISRFIHRLQCLGYCFLRAICQFAATVILFTIIENVQNMHSIWCRILSFVILELLLSNQFKNYTDFHGFINVPETTRQRIEIKRNFVRMLPHAVHEFAVSCNDLNVKF